MRKIFLRTLAAVVLVCAALLPIASAQATVREKLRVALVADNPPYQFVEDNALQGMHIDLMNAVADTVNLDVEYVPMYSELECFQALDSHQCDIILGVGLPMTEKYLSTAQILTQSTISMLIPSETMRYLQEGAEGIICSVVYENNTVPSLSQYSHIKSDKCYAKNLHRVALSSQYDAFRHFISGKADALFGEKQSILYQLRQTGLEEQYAIYYSNILAIQYTIAALKESSTLVEKLDRGFLEIHNNGRYDHIEENWTIHEETGEIHLTDILRKYCAYVLFAVGIILAVLLTFSTINRYLRKQVALQTEKLRQLNVELEQKIARSHYEGNLRALMIERNPSGIILMDKNGNITQCNQAAERLLGGKGTMSSVTASPFGAAMLSGKKESLFQQGTKYVDEFIKQGPPEHQRTFQYSLIPLREEKEIIGALLTINDITAKLEEKERLMEHEKSRVLNLVVAGIAHEIRNPLMVIKTFAQLLKVRKDDTEFCNSFSDMIPQEVDRINRLVEDLINFSKKSKHVRQKVDIAQLIDFCIRFLGSTIKKPWLEVNSTVEEGLILTADPDQIKQVFINVLLNACQAIEQKAAAGDCNTVFCLDIRAWSSGQSVIMQIRDEGIGMSEDVLNRVTDPFYTTKATGTGLGMAVSQRYVEENGGTIKFASVLGQYTVVTLSFQK